MPGRLLQRGEIEAVSPLEDEEALEQAKPIVGPAGVTFDADKVHARRAAMVARLPAEGVALLVLGASHDLTACLRPDVLYVKVTPRSLPLN